MKKIENFYRSLANLQDVYKYEPPYNHIILAGIVNLYGICFDQALKALKEVLEMQGVTEEKLRSPKQILKSAYQSGIITDETRWLEALLSRNNILPQTYEEEIALTIAQKIKEQYVQMFLALKSEIEKIQSAQ